MKLKQGDLVQIKPNLKEFDKTEYPSLTNHMLKKVGELFTVSFTEKNTVCKIVKFEEIGFSWRPKWLNKIKKVERQAFKGEFVLITNAGANGCTVPEFDGKPAYKNGDILKIIGSCSRFLEGMDDNRHEYVLYQSEYVVLEGYEDCDQVKKFEKPKYFTGKAVCIEVKGCLKNDAIVGKIYEFKNGDSKNERGGCFSIRPVKSIDELNGKFDDLKFIEVVE